MVESQHSSDSDQEDKQQTGIVKILNNSLKTMFNASNLNRSTNLDQRNSKIMPGSKFFMRPIPNSKLNKSCHDKISAGPTVEQK